MKCDSKFLEGFCRYRMKEKFEAAVAGYPANISAALIRNS